MTKQEKTAIYDKLCRMLTEYEEGNGVTAVDFYEALVDVVNDWEYITGEEN